MKVFNSKTILRWISCVVICAFFFLGLPVQASYTAPQPGGADPTAPTNPTKPYVADNYVASNNDGSSQAIDWGAIMMKFMEFTFIFFSQALQKIQSGEKLDFIKLGQEFFSSIRTIFSDDKAAPASTPPAANPPAASSATPPATATPAAAAPVSTTPTATQDPVASYVDPETIEIDPITLEVFMGGISGVWVMKWNYDEKAAYYVAQISTDPKFSHYDEITTINPGAVINFLENAYGARLNARVCAMAPDKVTVLGCSNVAGGIQHNLGWEQDEEEESNPVLDRARAESGDATLVLLERSPGPAGLHVEILREPYGTYRGWLVKGGDWFGDPRDCGIMRTDENGEQWCFEAEYTRVGSNTKIGGGEFYQPAWLKNFILLDKFLAGVISYQEFRTGVKENHLLNADAQENQKSYMDFVHFGV